MNHLIDTRNQIAEKKKKYDRILLTSVSQLVDLLPDPSGHLAPSNANILCRTIRQNEIKTSIQLNHDSKLKSKAVATILA